MPYLAHFGLEEHPFTLTPNVDYFFPTQEHANIIASVEFALRRDSGIIKVVGDVGTGKTLLCRLLVRKLVDTDSVAYINAPRADARSIVLAICEEFGLKVDENAETAYTTLNRFLVEEHAKGRMVVIVVDEAQHLGREGLEAIRLVSNLETETSKLLQIVLFGQTELDELLRDPALRQLNQRVVFPLTTKPLTEAETKNYVTHRIRVSRRSGIVYDVFSPRALDTIAARCGGIPRVINIVADKALLSTFAEGAPVVQPKHVVEALTDSASLLPAAPRRMPNLGRWRPRIAVGALAAAAALVLILLLLNASPATHSGSGPGSLFGALKAGVAAFSNQYRGAPAAAGPSDQGAAASTAPASVTSPGQASANSAVTPAPTASVSTPDTAAPPTAVAQPPTASTDASATAPATPSAASSPAPEYGGAGTGATAATSQTVLIGVRPVPDSATDMTPSTATTSASTAAAPQTAAPEPSYSDVPPEQLYIDQAHPSRAAKHKSKPTQTTSTQKKKPSSTPDPTAARLVTTSSQGSASAAELSTAPSASDEVQGPPSPAGAGGPPAAGTAAGAGH